MRYPLWVRSAFNPWMLPLIFVTCGLSVLWILAAAAYIAARKGYDYGNE